MQMSNLNLFYTKAKPVLWNWSLSYINGYYLLWAKKIVGAKYQPSGTNPS